MKILVLLILSYCSVFAQWEQCNNGLVTLKSQQIHSIAANGNNLVIGTNDGTYFSSDKGNTWVGKSNGLYLQGVWTVAFYKNMVLAGGWGGVYLSTDFGENWIQKNNGIIDSVGNTFAFDEDRIYLATCDNNHGGRVYISSDTCSTWIPKNIGMNFTNVQAIAIKGDSVYAAIDKTFGNYGVFLSTDKGETWISKSNGIDQNIVLKALIVDDGNIYLGTFGQYGGVYLSTDFGDNWIRMNNGLLDESGKIDPHVLAILSTNNALLAGTSERGVFLSTDKANNWHQKNIGLTSLSIQVLTATKDYIYAGTYGGIFRAKFEDLITGITEEFKIKSGISISPNPSSEYIEISYPPSEKKGLGGVVQVQIIDMLGMKITTLSLCDTPPYQGGEIVSLDVSGLAPGVYFIRVGVVVKKFVKI